MDNISLDKKIEAVLFIKNEPLTTKYLAQVLSANIEDVLNALKVLSVSLEDRAIRLIYKDDKVLLGSGKEYSDLVLDIKKSELEKDLGKAGLETLSIVLYRSPISRPEIDYIRGVNSTFILRNLMVRDLVERSLDEKNKKVYVYRPTFKLLAHLGLEKIEDLPQFKGVKKELEDFIKQKESGGEIEQ